MEAGGSVEAGVAEGGAGHSGWGGGRARQQHTLGQPATPQKGLSQAALGPLPGEAASPWETSLPWDVCSSHHCGCSPSWFIPRETHSALASKTTCLMGKQLTSGSLLFYPLSQEAWILGG